MWLVLSLILVKFDQSSQISILHCQTESKIIKETEWGILTVIWEGLPAELENIYLEGEFTNSLPVADPDMTQIRSTPVKF